MIRALLVLYCVIGVIAKKTSFDVFCQGNCNVDATPSETVSGVVLMGGGVSCIDIQSI
jgi:hypothetical protein